MSELRDARWLAALLVVFLVTCTDMGDPFAPGPTPETTPSAAAITCTAEVTNPTVRCGPRRTGTGAGLDPASLIVGGQGNYVLLESDNVAYAEELFTFDVTVRNLIGQALGTSDGTTVDGIQVFFTAPPVATGGAGTITVMGDGVGTYTGVNQPYYEYAQIVAPNVTSAARGWTLGVPATVTAFSFTVLVNAAIRYPDGWVDVAPASFWLAQGGTEQLTATVRNRLGAEIPDASVTWSIDDENLATISATGLVTAVALGPVTITAASGEAAGVVTATVVAPDYAPPVALDVEFHFIEDSEDNLIPIATLVEDWAGGPLKARIAGVGKQPGQGQARFEDEFGNGYWEAGSLAPDPLPDAVPPNYTCWRLGPPWPGPNPLVAPHFTEQQICNVPEDLLIEELLVTPHPDGFGANYAIFAFELTDGISVSNRGVILVHITPVNDAPRPTLGSRLDGWENHLLHFLIGGFDPEGDPFWAHIDQVPHDRGTVYHQTDTQAVPITTTQTLQGSSGVAAGWPMYFAPLEDDYDHVEYNNFIYTLREEDGFYEGDHMVSIWIHEINRTPRIEIAGFGQSQDHIEADGAIMRSVHDLEATLVRDGRYTLPALAVSDENMLNPNADPFEVRIEVTGNGRIEIDPDEYWIDLVDMEITDTLITITEKQHPDFYAPGETMTLDDVLNTLVYTPVDGASDTLVITVDDLGAHGGCGPPSTDFLGHCPKQSITTIQIQIQGGDPPADGTVMPLTAAGS